MVHTVTGCSQHETKVYNETVIALQTAITAQLCVSSLQVDLNQQGCK